MDSDPQAPNYSTGGHWLQVVGGGWGPSHVASMTAHVKVGEFWGPEECWTSRVDDKGGRLTGFLVA